MSRETFSLPARIVKADAARQIAYGVVLEPCTAETTKDSQGDWYTADDIELTAHDFLEAVSKGEAWADLMHDEGPAVGAPVESFVAPVDFVLGDGDRVQVVKAGSWVMAMHYPDPDVWARIEKGELDAFSVGGSGRRIGGEA
jgi:putative serine protease XkdF